MLKNRKKYFKAAWKEKEFYSHLNWGSFLLISARAAADVNRLRSNCKQTKPH